MRSSRNLVLVLLAVAPIIIAAVVLGVFDPGGSGVSGLGGPRSVAPAPTSTGTPGGSEEPTGLLEPTPLPERTPGGPPPRSARPDPTPPMPPTPAGSTPPASGRPTVGPAPTSAVGFDMHRTAIQIVFPLRPDAAFAYGDRFLAPRTGRPAPHQHARRVRGVLVRVHDGVDLVTRGGTPVLAPFAGTVIDPAARWRPWRADLYGVTVAIRSDEPATRGYVAILSHLRRAAVRPGERVLAGTVVGAVGRTGNARPEGPQLHLELRTPFRFPVREGGVRRLMDAFDPLPSLRRSDPRRPDT